MPATKVKLSQEEIDELVRQREEELLQEQERLKFEKSLKSLIKRMEKSGFYINKKLWAHMEPLEQDRWIVSNHRSS